MNPSAADARAALGPIAGGTITAADVDTVAASYVDYLGYRVVETGEVSEEVAQIWGALGNAGARQVVMQPESGAPQWIRLVEAPAVAGYVPLTTFGWHSLELVVADVDALPARLAGSPFEVIGEPRNLSVSKTIRAMQVRGAAQEVLYLTQIRPEPGKEYLPVAQSFVDRIFIVVLGSPDMAAARAFYETHFTVERGMEAAARIGVLNRAFGLDADTQHTICTVKLRGQSLIEIDDYPAVAGARPGPADGLPPGVAMVSFVVDSLDGVRLPFLAPPHSLGGHAYQGRRTAVCRGPAGERIELIEAGT